MLNQEGNIWKVMNELRNQNTSYIAILELNWCRKFEMISLLEMRSDRGIILCIFIDKLFFEKYLIRQYKLRFDLTIHAFIYILSITALSVGLCVELFAHSRCQ